jgi:hypothetical protein
VAPWKLDYCCPVSPGENATNDYKSVDDSVASKGSITVRYSLEQRKTTTTSTPTPNGPTNGPTIVMPGSPYGSSFGSPADVANNRLVDLALQETPRTSSIRKKKGTK